MKVAAYIPIKTNNQRVPGKNTLPLSDGTPLCNLIFNTVNSICEIDEKYVFCSDESIVSLIPDGIKFLKRGKELDSSEAKAQDLNEAFINEVDADIYVIIHVTSPFIGPDTISECINAVKSDQYDSATTVCVLRDFLWDEDGPMNFDPANIIRTQDMKKIFRETTGLYVFKKEVFTKYRRSVGVKPYFKEVGPIEGLDIDYKEDFEIVDAVYMKKINKNMMP